MKRLVMGLWAGDTTFESRVDLFRFGNTVGADRSQAEEYLRELTTRNTMNRGAK